MTRKDYNLIAKVLRENHSINRGSDSQWNILVEAMAKALSEDSGLDLNGNRRFDRDRFLAACRKDNVR